MRLFQLIVVSLILQVAGASAENRIAERSMAFTLQDQYGESVSLRQFEGRVLVMIASDKEGSAQNGPWKEALISRYQNSIALLGLADVRTVPFFMTGIIKSKFRKEKGRVLMDWRAEVFKDLGLPGGVSNIIVIDQRSHLRYVASGAASEKALAALFTEIDRLQQTLKKEE